MYLFIEWYSRSIKWTKKVERTDRIKLLELQLPLRQNDRKTIKQNIIVENVTIKKLMFPLT